MKIFRETRFPIFLILIGICASYISRVRADSVWLGDSEPLKVTIEKSDPHGELIEVPNFPCDLSTITALPRLVLVGERDHMDRTIIEHRHMRVKQAARNEIRLATEGSIFAGQFDANNSDGIENPTVFAVSVTPEIMGGFIGSKENFLNGDGADFQNASEEVQDRAMFRTLSFSVQTANLVKHLRDNPVLEKSWKNVKRPFSDAPTEEAAKYLDEAGEKASKLEITPFSTPPELSHFSALISLLTKLSISSADIALKNPDELKTPPNLKSVLDDDLKGNKFRVKRLEDPFREIVLLRWRNYFIVRNIAQLYCSALKAQKDFWVILGSAHVESIKTLLQKANDKIPIGTFDPLEQAPDR